MIDLAHIGHARARLEHPVSVYELQDSRAELLEIREALVALVVGVREVVEQLLHELDPLVAALADRIEQLSTQEASAALLAEDNNEESV